MIDYENEAAEVRARINSLLKEKGVTQNAVAAGDAPAQKRLNSQLSHGAAISLDSVLRVLNACPDVSADWLLRGSGDIYIANGACSTGKVTGAENGPHQGILRNYQKQAFRILRRRHAALFRYDIRMV